MKSAASLFVLAFATGICLAQSFPRTPRPVQSMPESGVAGPAASVLAYSNRATYTGYVVDVLDSGAISGNNFTTLTLDEVTPLASEAGYPVRGISFAVYNSGASSLQFNPRFVVYDDDGAGGQPGTRLGSWDLGVKTQAAGVGKIYSFDPGAGALNLPSNRFWAGITYSSIGTSPTTSASSLLNLSTYLYQPPTIGSSADLLFDSTAASDALSSNPAGYTYTLAPANISSLYLSFSVDKTVHVTGTLSLPEFTGNTSGIPVEVIVRSPGGGTVYETLNLVLGSGGAIDIPISASGVSLPSNLEFGIKASHWLRSVALKNVGTSGNSGEIFVAGVNGDIVNDNIVDLADFDAFSVAFGSAPGDGNWNADADINGDEVVDLGDFDIFASHFGAEGPA